MSCREKENPVNLPAKVEEVKKGLEALNNLPKGKEKKSS